MFAGNLFEKQALINFRYHLPSNTVVFINMAGTPADGLLFLDMTGLLIIVKSTFICGEVYADLRISM